MKLKKREITLNEADSLQDVFYLEKMLLQGYENGEAHTFRKEAQNQLLAMKQRAVGSVEQVERLWEKAKAEQL